jgi:DNA-binding transcriptional LysR family regulator
MNFHGDMVMDLDDRVLRRLKLSDLRLLYAVVQWRGMAKAAARLNISQPAVSKAIAALEQTLGVRLLDRTPRGIEPTIYGQALLKGGTAIFEELSQSVKQIRYLADPEAGELRIGGSDPMVAGLIPAVIERLSRKYPRITFHVTEAESVLHQYRALREHEVEFVIGRLPQSVREEDLDVEILFQEPLLVAAGLQNRWVRRRRIDLAELIDEPWVLPGRDSFIGSIVADLFRERGFELPHNSVTCGSIQMNNALLATGRYLAIYPGSLLRLSITPLPIKVLPTKLPIGSTTAGIVTLKNRTISPVARLFIDYARALVRPLAKQSK